MEQPFLQIEDLRLPLVRPQSVAEVGEVVRRAAAEKQAIYPVGGQTMLDYGLPPGRPGIAVDMRGLDRVIDYPARDMTITVEAGITIRKLQELLATENQRLPIDVPRAEQATLGGILATNTSGPRRYGFGTLRDYVIGISVINDEGQETKAGGRVVKNVAGYDLCKLHIGALGTLGAIIQVTLKLKPRPEARGFLLVGCKQEALESLLERVHGSRTRPVCLELLNRPATESVLGSANTFLSTRPWSLLIGFEDNQVALSWQGRQLVDHELKTNPIPGMEVIASLENRDWDGLADVPVMPEASLTFKANMMPHAVASFCRQADALPDKPQLQAHAGNGIVIGHLGPGLTLERAQAMLSKLHNWAKAGEGNVIVMRCPTDWKKTLPVWGIPRGDWGLMRTIKQKLDPRSVFNPGRFIDSI